MKEISNKTIDLLSSELMIGIKFINCKFTNFDAKRFAHCEFSKCQLDAIGVLELMKNKTIVLKNNMVSATELIKKLNDSQSTIKWIDDLNSSIIHGETIYPNDSQVVLLGGQNEFKS